MLVEEVAWASLLEEGGWIGDEEVGEVSRKTKTLLALLLGTGSGLGGTE